MTQAQGMNSLTKTQKQNLNMGYCCINVHLRNLGIFTSRTCRLDTIREKGLSHSYDLAMRNLEDMAAIFRWNFNNNIFLYRMSSEIFPFASHPEFCEKYDMSRFVDILASLGQLAKKYNQTVTFHPGQYNQLTSSKENVVHNSIIDINFHANILDLMQTGSDSIIIIHGGAKADGKDVCLERLKRNFYKLSQSAQNRLVLENCEMAYSITDLLPLCQDLSIPLVVDYHHHNIHPGDSTLLDKTNLLELTKRVLLIWKKRKITPLFHLSESKPGITVSHSLTDRRAHSDYVNNLPDALLELLETERINLDIEAKMKEKAVLHLLKQYY